ncbi:fimbrial protein [Serratia grimesii]|uniref:fimbrial protein n=1 Tax=Serratia grimesii TaxID=82995 RepID=UPI0039AF8BF9
MKLKAIATVIPALFSVSAFAADIEGGTSRVTFTGKVIEASCTVSQDSLNQVIDMGTIAAGDLSQARKGKERNFNIKVSGCNDTDGLAKAYVIFKGATTNQDSTILSTTGNNDTVGIEIKHNGQPVILDGEAKTADVKIGGDGNALFNFTANYVALQDNVETGDANASADFTIFYN